MRLPYIRPYSTLMIFRRRWRTNSITLKILMLEATVKALEASLADGEDSYTIARYRKGLRELSIMTNPRINSHSNFCTS